MGTMGSWAIPPCHLFMLSRACLGPVTCIPLSVDDGVLAVHTQFYGLVGQMIPAHDWQLRLHGNWVVRG